MKPEYWEAFGQILQPLRFIQRFRVTPRKFLRSYDDASNTNQSTNQRCAEYSFITRYSAIFFCNLTRPNILFLLKSSVIVQTVHFTLDISTLILSLNLPTRAPISVVKQSLNSSYYQYNQLNQLVQSNHLLLSRCLAIMNSI